MKPLQPYEPRPIRFLEIWEHAGWRLKVYGIAYRRPAPRPELVQAAMRVAAERLNAIPCCLLHYSVGFLGIHDGRTANFVFVDWWADENELHHHVYISPTNDPEALDYRTPTGLAACVWDLRVIGFERDAWLTTVLRNPTGPDLEEYLRTTLNEDV
ncbi:MAG: isochorismatase [Verrucomicrobiae bacterium]|nr:isochorismatase [Verrucomicrobiae bacterium]